MSETAYVQLDHPAYGAPLRLERLPLFLRFVYRPRRCGRGVQWDALDQLDDEPQAEETVIAAQLVRRGTLHIDRVVRGQRVGSWHQAVQYHLCDPQPPENVKRDREKWQAWCQAQYEQLKEA